MLSISGIWTNPFTNPIIPTSTLTPLEKKNETEKEAKTGIINIHVMDATE